MTEHPLTDGLCCQLWQDNKDDWLKLQEPFPATRRIMRAAYDLGRNEQLEQVIEWLRKNLDERYVYIDFDDGDVLTPGIDVESAIIDLKQAMRPTTQEDN